MVFDRYGAVYDLLYAGKDSQAEAAYVHRILMDEGTRVRDVLEVGCGTGRHARPLVEAGYVIHGVERSEEMVKRAQQVDGFTVSCGDIRDVELGRQFDAAVALFHVLGYLTEQDHLEAGLQNIWNHLLPGAVFIFDFWHTAAVYGTGPENRLHHYEGPNSQVWKFATPRVLLDENVVEVSFDILMKGGDAALETFSELHRMRHFSIFELNLLATKIGFEVVRYEPFMEDGTVSSDTWGVTAVWRKRA